MTPGRRLRREDPQGRQAGRSAGPATDHIRAGRQSQDREGARPYRPAIDPRPRRRGHRMMNRRELMLMLGTAVTAAPAVRAQQKAMPVIGFLGVNSPGPFAPLCGRVPPGAERNRLRRGTKRGDRIPLGGGPLDRLPALAADLVGRKVDVIVASGGLSPALAAKSATSTIPIVFTGLNDPVAAGLVASLARPGGNLTGFSQHQFRTDAQAARAAYRAGSPGQGHRPAREPEQSVDRGRHQRRCRKRRARRGCSSRF